MLDLEKLLSIPYVDPENGFDISPDGRSLAFSWNRTGQWEIYLLDIGIDSSGSVNVPRQITSGPGAKFSPSFSPNGGFLIYIVDQNGSEEFDLVLYNLQTKYHFNLTPDTPYSIQPNYTWSPSGDQVAFLSDQSGRFWTYLMRVEEGVRNEPRLQFNQSGPHIDVDWSPDGSRLVVVAESEGQDFESWVVPIEEGLSAFPISFQGVLLNAKGARWSPDGAKIAFSGCSKSNENLPEYVEIGIFELQSSEVTWVASGRGDKNAPKWSPDGMKLVYILSDGPDTWLVIHLLGIDSIEVFQVEPGVHHSQKFHLDGRRIFFIFDNPRHPDDLWLLDSEKGTIYQLTNSLPVEINSEQLCMPRKVSYPSLDGRTVPALLYEPNRQQLGSEVTKPAAVLVVHGGPTWLFQYLWYPFMTHLVSRGWLVLAPNYRGSTGYGRSWQLANRFDIGHGDTMDVATGVDYLVQSGLADERRIAITGRSHGGYLTMSCLTSYPERWAAGSAIVPFLNWFTSHANSRQDLQHWDIQNMGKPSENQELWHERSPYFFLDRIKAPVQLVCGANDPRCPASESVAARDALVALGKTVDFLLYPDEGHAFLKIENVVDHEVKRASFLAKHLEG